MIGIKTFIEVPFSFYATHRYPGAPEEVKFLREAHPHDFTCTATIEVRADDRELEFYLVREFLNQRVAVLPRNVGESSCERLAFILLEDLQSKYGTDLDITVLVQEDNRYGARKVYTH